MGKLTTHVLDTAKGQPASGLRVDVYFAGERLHSAVTNADGRIDAPLLQGDQLKVGMYEIQFHAGEYLLQQNSSFKQPLFLDVIPIRFGIADATQHYHVPLLLSPFGYSTYRGS
jgi:5-hydroxyisourate hydrolase